MTMGAVGTTFDVVPAVPTVVLVGLNAVIEKCKQEKICTA